MYFVKSIGLDITKNVVVKKVNANDEPAYGEIIKVDGVIGVVVSDMENKKHFWDRSTSTYSPSYLPFVGEYEKTTHEEKVEFLTKHFKWGEVVKTHMYAEYLIFEYIDEKGKTYFHPYDNYYNMGKSCESIYHAIAGVIAIKYDDVNTKADSYFARAISM